MKTLPTQGFDPRMANSDARGRKILLTYAKELTLHSEKGRVARKRKKFILKMERQHYVEALVAVAQELQKRKNSGKENFEGERVENV